MQRTAISGVVIAILATAIGLAGCASTSNGKQALSKSSSSPTPAATATTPSAHAKVAPRMMVPGPNPTIAGYLQQNGITETPSHRGDPGAPTIDLPVPDGWANAGPDTPTTAYWAIIDTGPEAANYTASIVVTASKLTGNVDQQKILDLAAGELKNLPGFKPMSDGSSSTLADFPAYQFGGTWVENGQTKAVAQKTVVIPASGAVYVVRFNADCLEDQISQALPATMTIDEKTKITA
jgi:Probable lipoprotein LpqN